MRHPAHPDELLEIFCDEVKGSAGIEVGDVQMPMLMGGLRLHESGPFLGKLRIAAPHQPGFAEQSIDASRADGDNIRVEHHVGQAAIAIERMFEMELDNRLLLPVLQPVILGIQPLCS